jgi:DNA polymerase elongation subunit (family B)
VDFDNVDDQALTEYCKRDVEILRDATLHYLKFVSDNNLGSDAYTVAGQSFAAYTHRFMAKRIYVHTDKRALELERQAYKGGMVRALQVGYRSDGPFYKLDVNSMYPYVMRENRYPTKLLSVVDNPSLEYLAKVLKVCCVIADCTVHPKSDYFPTRLKTTNIYPAYEYRDVFTTPELQRLLEEGSIIQIHHMAIYSDRSIFRDYVEYFYNKRKEAKAKGNLPYVQICKMFLNGLYGKFGSRNCSYRRAPEFDYLNPHTEVIRLNPGEPLRHVLFLEGKCYLEERGEESYNAFPAIAAHVTAYARMYLAKLIDRARRENVLYCDTDSLIVTRDGYDRLQAYINPDDLGMLKEEGKVDTVTIFGRKDYLFGGEVKRKGVSLKLGTVAVENNIKETWPGMLTFMKGKTKGLVKITRKPLHLCRKVYDGKLTDTGKVLPFNLPPAYFATYYDLPLYLLHPADRIAA